MIQSSPPMPSHLVGAAAAMAGELVERLGLRTQDTAAPPDLFTAPEQEAEVAEVPAAE